MKLQMVLLTLVVCSALALACDPESKETSDGDEVLAINTQVCLLTEQAFEIADLNSTTVSIGSESGWASMSRDVTERGTLGGLELAWDVVLSGEKAYVSLRPDWSLVCNDDGGCHEVQGEPGHILVIDITDPDNPIAESTVQIPNPLRLRILGSNLFVVQKELGLTSFPLDSKDPTTSLASLTFPANEMGNPVVVRDVTAVKDKLFVATNHGLYVLTGPNEGTFTIVASDPTTALSACIPSETDSNYLYCAGDGRFVPTRTTSGDHTFLKLEPHALMVYDIADPLTPHVVFLQEQDDNKAGYDIVVTGDVAFVVEPGLGVVTWDLSDPKSPKETDYVMLPGPLRVATQAGWLYVATTGYDNLPFQGSGVNVFNLDFPLSLQSCPLLRPQIGPAQALSMAIRPIP